MVKKLKIIISIIVLILIFQQVISYGVTLPEGARKIETNNWTKTPEIHEVQEEKKLNSDMEVINIDSYDEQAIHSLIDGKNNIQSMEKIIELKENEGTTASKILRTKKANYNIAMSSIYSWLRSDNQFLWSKDSNNIDIYDWKQNYRGDRYGNTIEWRLFKGEFFIDAKTLKLIDDKKLVAALGIETMDGFETIFPFKDLVNIFINSKLTPMNYSVSRNMELRIDNNTIKYRTPLYSDNDPLKPEYCDKANHRNLSSHIYDNHHAHLNTLVQNSSTMIGDLGKYININDRKNTIEILCGQIGKSSDAYKYDGGISKLDIFLVENPNLEVEIIPYRKNPETNENIYLDKEESLIVNEKIYYRIQIKNKSDKVSISDSIISTTVGSSNTEKFEITSNGISRGGKPINSDNIKAYLNDSKIPEEKGLDILKDNLSSGDTISIESDDINYNVTQSDLNYKEVTFSTDLTCRYLNKRMTYNRNRMITKIKVSKEDISKGAIKIRVDIEVGENNNLDDNDMFYIQIKNQNQHYNLEVKPGEYYTIDNLDYNCQYEVKSIVPMNYKIVSISTSQNNNTNIILNTTNKEATIHINAKKLSEQWFTDKKKEELKLIIN